MSFIAKLSAKGRRLLYSTYLGGSGGECPRHRCGSRGQCLCGRQYRLHRLPHPACPATGLRTQSGGCSATTPLSSSSMPRALGCSTPPTWAGAVDDGAMASPWIRRAMPMWQALPAPPTSPPGRPCNRPARSVQMASARRLYRQARCHGLSAALLHLPGREQY